MGNVTSSLFDSYFFKIMFDQCQLIEYIFFSLRCPQSLTFSESVNFTSHKIIYEFI